MAGTVTDRTPLGATTTARKWWLDVREVGSQVWLGVHGIQESKPRPSEATTQDDSDMDGGGHKSQTTTALTSGFDGKLIRKTRRSDALAYDPGQEIIRLASRRIGSEIEVRFYEMEPGGPRIEAYEGRASATWTPDGGAMDATDTVAFALTGRGQLAPITHPDTTPAIAAIASALPQPAAAGASVVIKGARFTGATVVKFGAVNATGLQVLDDSTILCVVPAGSAGSAPITVTTPAGVSAALPYTRS